MAASATPPTYNTVKVLLICWKDSTQPEFEKQLKTLAKELQQYRFDLEPVYTIESIKPHQNLAWRLHEFLKFDGDGTLLIIYYGGHGLNDSDQNNIWLRDDPADVDIRKNPKVNWSALQSLFLDECKSHVLFLLDCCFAASAVQYTHGVSTVEAIVAVGFDRVAPLQGKDSFTKFLTDVLKRCRGDFDGVYASRLCALVASGLNQTRSRVGDGPGRRVTPHHLVYSNRPSTIFLYPLNTLFKSDESQVVPTHATLSLFEEETVAKGEELSTRENGSRSSPADFTIGAKLQPEPHGPQYSSTLVLRPPPAARARSETSLTTSTGTLAAGGISLQEQARDEYRHEIGSVGSVSIPSVSVPDFNPISSSRSEGPEHDDHIPSRPRSVNSDYGLGGRKSHVSSKSRLLLDLLYTSKYVFSRLSNNEIRVAHIHPSQNPANPISYSFSVHNLVSGNAAYRAISYVAGDPGDNIVHCIHKNDRYSISITPSLDEALRRIRDKTEEISIWADMLCMDTRNRGEQYEQQLYLMPLIFKKADEVIVWLGTGDNDSKTAMGFIPQLVNLRKFDNLVKNEATSNQWQALVRLMENEYFSRRWAFLEVILAQQAVIYCGTQKILWDDFCDAVLLLGSRFEDIQYLCMRYAIANDLEHDLYNLADLRALPAYSVVEASRNIFRKPAARTLSYIEEPPTHRHFASSAAADRTLQTLVSLLPGLQTNAPHDVIYALLAVASDRLEIGIEIDYAKPALEMYQQFIRYCATTSMKIDIICRPWAPKPVSSRRRPRQRDASWPSWICTTENLPFGGPTQGVYSRRNGDVLIGHPGRRTYDAAHGTVAVPIFGKTSKTGIVEYDGSMIANGFQVGTINELEQRASNGTLHREWIDRSHWEMGSPSILDDFWRTLVADRGPGGIAAPAWYHRACLYWLELRGGDDVNYTVLHHKDHPSSAVQYMQRVQSVIWNRKLFTMEDKLGRTLYGLAPEDARPHDSVVILYGCSVPVVLRQKQDTWQLLGECFVYGIMEGEAMRIEQYLKATEEFMIC